MDLCMYVCMYVSLSSEGHERKVGRSFNSLGL